jgi:hypothetical protein
VRVAGEQRPRPGDRRLVDQDEIGQPVAQEALRQDETPAGGQPVYRAVFAAVYGEPPDPPATAALLRDLTAATSRPAPRDGRPTADRSR